MTKLEKNIIKYLIMIYFLFIYFNGIVTKTIILINTNLLSVKGIIPDITLIILCIYGLYLSLKYKFKTKNIYFIGIYFFVIIFVVSLIDLKNFNQFIFTFRDVLLPFLLLITLVNIKVDYKFSKELLNFIERFFEIAVIIGTCLAIIQYINGWEWTSKFYTGYSFYGADKLSNIVIKTIEGNLRVPSISGSHVLFGIMNVVAAYIFIIKKHINECKYFYLKQLLCVIGCYISTSRTALIMIITLYLFILLNNNVILKYVISIFSCILIYMSLYIDKISTDSYMLSIGSLIARVNVVWKSLLDSVDLKLLFMGKNVYSVGSGVSFIDSNSSNLYRVMDNSYIFILFSYGIIGCILIGLIIYIMCKLINEKIIKVTFVCFTQSILLGAIFTNLLQGRAIVGVYFLIYFMIKDFKINNLEKEQNR